MPEEQTQEPTMDKHDMSDDDMAAALGFITTLGEHTHKTMNPEEDPNAQSNTPDEGTGEAPQEQPTQKTPEDHEAEQDTEIQAIRTELEQLLAQENGTKTENTGVTQ